MAYANFSGFVTFLFWSCNRPVTRFRQYESHDAIGQQEARVLLEPEVSS